MSQRLLTRLSTHPSYDLSVRAFPCLSMCRRLIPDDRHPVGIYGWASDMRAHWCVFCQFSIKFWVHLHTHTHYALWYSSTGLISPHVYWASACYKSFSSKDLSHTQQNIPWLLWCSFSSMAHARHKSDMLLWKLDVGRGGGRAGCVCFWWAAPPADKQQLGMGEWVSVRDMYSVHNPTGTTPTHHSFR